MNDKNLTKKQKDLIKEGSVLAELIDEYTAKLFNDADIDDRLLSMGINILEIGFMSLAKSITKGSLKR